MFPSSPVNLPNLAANDSMANAGAAAGNPMGMVAYLNALAAELNSLETALLAGSWSSVPTGTIIPFGGPIAPVNYLLCNGVVQSRTTYANLWAALSITTTGTTAANSPIITGMGTTAGMEINHPIAGPGIPNGAYITSIDSASQIHISNNAGTGAGTGTIIVAPWGHGDYSTTFGIPDLRGRTLCGRGTGAGLTGRWLGGIWGEENHILVTGELASHLHGADHYHTINFGQINHSHNIDFSQVNHGHGTTENPHHHTYNEVGAGGANLAASGSATYNYTTGNTSGVTTGLAVNPISFGLGGSATASFGNGSSAYASATNGAWANTGAAGGGNGHNNIQPMAAINHIIRI